MEGRIKNSWGAPVCNLYGSSESLFLAVRNSNDEAMRVMSDLNVLEILDETHNPVKSGDEGRVTITNLYNHAFPILRYELGDYVIRGDAFEGEAIQSIRPGKDNEALPVFLDDGTPDKISSRALTAFYALSVERAQFICLDANRIRVDYVSRTDVDDRVRSEFQRILDLKGASNTAFDVRRVPSIAADPITGKVRPVVLQRARGRHEPLNLGRQPSEPTPNLRALGPRRSTEFEKADIEQSISNRFELQVERFSDRLAVKTAATSLTYNELNRRANRIAHAVLRFRSQAQEPVTFLLGQGISAIATMIGILKAGRFYLSLDPTYPAAWLAAILEHAQCPLIVTDNANMTFASSLGYQNDEIINIDELHGHLPDGNPDVSVSPDAFAYLYYTSGSGGRPKAMAHTHRHALHQIATYTNLLNLRADDRCTQLHSPTFSASRLDIFGPLLNGGAVLPFSVATEGPLQIYRWLRNEKITVFHWVPSAFRHYLEMGQAQETFSSVRLLILGSEAMTYRDVELCRKHFAASCTLVNRYGATETGNICIYFIDREQPMGDGTVPVGHPIEDVTVQVLNEAGDEAEFDEVGQIEVLSPYFSGYWRQPEMTKAQFATDTASPARTRYRTGDSGYIMPDGRLVQIGRNDTQVKVRGHRIDLGQIERALVKCPTIAEAAVLTHSDQPGDTALVAYVVVRDGAPLAPDTIRSSLATRLPPYMIPDSFIQMHTLPTTPAGKIDRRSLPSPSPANVIAKHIDSEPRNDLERELANLWSDVLAVSRVGIHDNFLDLGGHSLLAGKLIARISQVFIIEINFRDFFEHPTVAGLAEFLADRSNLASHLAGKP